MKVAIIGTGYVGLVTAVALANIGHNVICIDKNKNKIKQLKKGFSPIYEKNLEDMMTKNKERLYFTSDYQNALKDISIIFICVGTPEKEDLAVNLDYIYDVCNNLLNEVHQDSIVVVKSTVPIGTNDKIEKILNENSKYSFKVVSNPEFLSQGTAIYDSLYASRIIIGTCDSYSQNVMKELYAPLTKPPYNVPILTVSRNAAELIKYVSNSFLALKLSYINEVANLCDKIGVNIEEVVQGVGLDNRIGKYYLKTGIGYGGSCLPKDINALYQFSLSENSEIKTLKTCIDVNKSQNLILFEKLKQSFKNNLENKSIAILGLSFKPGTDDVRKSPAFVNVDVLLRSGAKIKLYDPKAMNNFKKVINNNENFKFVNNVNFYNSIDDTIKDCDAVLIITDWDEIKKYNVNKFKKLMKQTRIYDGRNCIDINQFDNLKDVQYVSIGKNNFNNINENN